MTDVITIDVHGVKPRYVAKYVVLINPKIEEVIKKAIDHPKAFIFIFDTTHPERVKEDMADYSSLFPEYTTVYYEDYGEYYEEVVAETVKPWMERILTPLYIGNFRECDWKALIENRINSAFCDCEKELV